MTDYVRMIYVCYVGHDGTYNLDIWFCYSLPLLLFIYIITLLMIWLHYYYIAFHHIICTRTFHFILYTHWEFWLFGFAHPSLWLFLLMTRYLGRIICITRSLMFTLFDPKVFFLSLLYFQSFSWFSIYWSQCLFYSFIHLLSCVKIYVIL